MYRTCLVAALAVAACEEAGKGGTASGPSSASGPTSMTSMAPTESSSEATSGASSGANSEATSEGAGDATTAATSGPPPPDSCDDVTQCRLHGDCCTCDALRIDETPPPCDLACDRDKCDDWGITEILCSHTCLVRLVECDASLVECADEPPVCAVGTVPSVEARCWTRHCVPAELCVPT